MSDYKKLIKKLDAIFSKFIRLRDSNEQGIGFCITCGRAKHWKQADCGHYIKRQYLATRFDEMNTNLQCKFCNAFEQGANEKYRPALDEKWGAGTAHTLELRKHNKTKLPIFFLESEIERYKEKVKVLESKK